MKYLIILLFPLSLHAQKQLDSLQIDDSIQKYTRFCKIAMDGCNRYPDNSKPEGLKWFRLFEQNLYTKEQFREMQETLAKQNRLKKHKKP